MSYGKRILIFEDESDIAEVLRRTLIREQFNVKVRKDGERFRDAVEDFKPDVVLLDILLPGVDGLRICRTLKENPPGKEVKIILVSARGEQEDILQGFARGADDYIIKPFRIRELVARVKSVLRRQNTLLNEKKPKIVRHAELIIDPQRHEVKLNGNSLQFTISEYKLLLLMANAPGRVYSRTQLSEELTAYGNRECEGSRHIDVHIRSLRKKLGDHAEMIRTMRGVGYFFEAPSQSPTESRNIA